MRAALPTRKDHASQAKQLVRPPHKAMLDAKPLKHLRVSLIVPLNRNNPNLHPVHQLAITTRSRRGVALLRPLNMFGYLLTIRQAVRVILSAILPSTDVLL
ncbi:MAG TPA: hypothetical protein VN788_14340 [Verrucomicrobiae bacterium]|nr:hypothetical protein [Verrucomicrobiae bacterium]